jgi:hypothetical protein
LPQRGGGDTGGREQHRSDKETKEGFDGVHTHEDSAGQLIWSTRI